MTEVAGRALAQAGSYEWMQFAAGQPADPVPVPPSGGSGLVKSGRAILTAIGIKNTATAAGEVDILDGQDSKGQLVVPIQIAASSSTFLTFGPRGIILEIGCFIVVTAANLTGSIMMVHLFRYPGLTPPGE